MQRSSAAIVGYRRCRVAQLGSRGHCILLGAVIHAAEAATVARQSFGKEGDATMLSWETPSSSLRASQGSPRRLLSML